MVASSSLVVGQYYKVTNFRTRHLIPNTAEYNEGAEEAIIIKAISATEFSYEAASCVYPNDELHYEFVDSSGAGGDRGRITMRRDNVDSIEMTENWRATRYRWWETSAGSGVFSVMTDNGGAYVDRQILNGAINQNIKIGVPANAPYQLINSVILGDCVNVTAEGDFFENYFGGTFKNSHCDNVHIRNKWRSDFEGNNIGYYCADNDFGQPVKRITTGTDFRDHIGVGTSQFSDSVVGSNVGVCIFDGTNDRIENLTIAANTTGKTYTGPCNGLVDVGSGNTNVYSKSITIGEGLNALNEKVFMIGTGGTLKTTKNSSYGFAVFGQLDDQTIEDINGALYFSDTDLATSIGTTAMSFPTTARATTFLRKNYTIRFKLQADDSVVLETKIVSVTDDSNFTIADVLPSFTGNIYMAVDSTPLSIFDSSGKFEDPNNDPIFYLERNGSVVAGDMLNGNYWRTDKYGFYQSSGEAESWDDVQFQISSGKAGLANAPTWEMFTTNTAAYSFAVNDYIDLGANEPFHGWKEGSDSSVHMHITTKAANNSGADRFAKFEIVIGYADVGETWTETTLTAELTIPNGTPALKHFLLSMGTLSMPNNLLGTQIKPRIKRIAATGGTEYASSAFITQVGIHILKNTLGSREIATK